MSIMATEGPSFEAEVVIGNSQHLTKEKTMNVEKATWLLVAKRLVLSRSTYKLIGILLVALGVTSGSEVMGWIQSFACIALGGCVEWPATLKFGSVSTLPP